jgi:hypothetical protein
MLRRALRFSFQGDPLRLHRSNIVCASLRASLRHNHAGGACFQRRAVSDLFVLSRQPMKHVLTPWHMRLRVTQCLALGRGAAGFVWLYQQLRSNRIDMQYWNVTPRIRNISCSTALHIASITSCSHCPDGPCRRHREVMALLLHAHGN